MKKKEKGIWIFLGIILLFCLVGFVMTSASTFIVAMIVSGIVYAIGSAEDRKMLREGKERRKGAVVARMLLMILVVGILFTMPPIYMSSSSHWQYPYQKAFVGIYQNIEEPEWFPDFEEVVEEEYYFDYIPSIMQATGHYSVQFVTSPERATAYASEYETKAVYVIPLQEYEDGYWIPSSESTTEEVYDDNRLTFYLDEEFWAGCWNDESTATIYVLETNLDWNHPHSSVVIIDAEKGRVQFVQEG